MHPLNPRVRRVSVAGTFQLDLEFADGSRGRADLRSVLAGRGGVLAPLADREFFARVSVDPEAGTVVWPNGADLDPDVLFDLTAIASQGARGE